MTKSYSSRSTGARAAKSAAVKAGCPDPIAGVDFEVTTVAEDNFFDLSVTWGGTFQPKAAPVSTDEQIAAAEAESDEWDRNVTQGAAAEVDPLEIPDCLKRTKKTDPAAAAAAAEADTTRQWVMPEKKAKVAGERKGRALGEKMAKLLAIALKAGIVRQDIVDTLEQSNPPSTQIIARLAKEVNGTVEKLPVEGAKGFRYKIIPGA